MALQSKLLQLLPADYGYVIFAGVGSTFVNMWLAINVARARKRYDVPLPIMYSPENGQFNCIQRAHQNAVENSPQFLFLLVVAGLEYPKASAAAGLLYLVGRVVFAQGYYTGTPGNHKYGCAISTVGMLALVANTICIATRKLGICSC